MNRDLAIELVRGLETVKRFHLRNSAIVTKLADVVYRHDVKDLALLNEIAESLLSVKPENLEKDSFQVTPQELLDAEVIEREIVPLVTDIRRKLFGSGDIPFSSREAALGWLDEYALSDMGFIKELRKSAKISDGVLRISIWEGRIFVGHSPPIILQEETGKISDDLGIDAESLSMHVLTNSRLVVPKYTVRWHRPSRKLPSGQWTSINEVVLRFRGAINLEDMHKIYRAIRTQYKFGRFKQTTAKHLDLYRMVNKKEIPAKKGKVAFWRSIMKEWNGLHPETRYATWKGISVAYDRILKGKQSKLKQQEESDFGMQVVRLVESYQKSRSKEVQNERKHDKERKERRR